MEKQYFKGKYCKLVLDNDFVLYGYVQDIDDEGLYFKTDKGTAYQKWSGVKSIVERREY